jgi:hypothetical protein
MNQRITLKKLTISMAIIAAVFVFASCSKKQPAEQNNKQNENQNQQDQQRNQTIDMDINNWREYKSPKFDFQISFPSDWEVAEYEDPKAGFALKSPNYQPISNDSKGRFFYKGEINIDLHENRSSLELKEFIDSFSDMSGTWIERFPYSEIKIGAYDAIMFSEFNDSQEPYYSTPNNNRVVFLEINDAEVVSFSYVYIEKNEKMIEVLDMIVRSLKVVE